MSLDTWGFEVWQQDEALTGPGRICLGKSRKGGESREIELIINDRRVFQLQELLNALLEEPGHGYAKRAIVLIAEDIRKAIARSHRQEERQAVLRSHGITTAAGNRSGGQA